MNLQLSPETEALLNFQAAQVGKSPEVFVAELLQDQLAIATSAPQPTVSEADLDAVAAAWSDDFSTPLDREAVRRHIRLAKDAGVTVGFRWISTEMECDPQEPDLPWIVLTFSAPATMERVLVHQIEWHDHLERTVGSQHNHLRIRIAMEAT